MLLLQRAGNDNLSLTFLKQASGFMICRYRFKSFPNVFILCLHRLLSSKSPSLQCDSTIFLSNPKSCLVTMPEKKTRVRGTIPPRPHVPCSSRHSALWSPLPPLRAASLLAKRTVGAVSILIPFTLGDTHPQGSFLPLRSRARARLTVLPQTHPPLGSPCLSVAPARSPAPLTHRPIPHRSLSR